jgi:hypothetical protein
MDNWREETAPSKLLYCRPILRFHQSLALRRSTKARLSIPKFRATPQAIAIRQRGPTP